MTSAINGTKPAERTVIDVWLVYNFERRRYHRAGWIFKATASLPDAEVFLTEDQALKAARKRGENWFAVSTTAVWQHCEAFSLIEPCSVVVPEVVRVYNYGSERSLPLGWSPLPPPGARPKSPPPPPPCRPVRADIRPPGDE